MVLHLESVERALSPNGLWEQGFQFGDWLDPDAPPEAAARLAEVVEDAGYKVSTGIAGTPFVTWALSET